MGKIQVFVFGSAVIALSMISATLLPMAAHGQAGKAEPGPTRPRMHRMMGIEAPWISIALRHQSELNLSPDQVATLKKIQTDYRDQITPIQERLQATEVEITNSLQETPANLIQAKLKIEEAEKLRSELRYKRVETLEYGKSVLTAEQRDQLKNLVSSRHRSFRKQQRQPS